MPDYQTAEGMAVEPYERREKKLRHALKKIYKICHRGTVNLDVLIKIKTVAEKALGLHRKHGR